MEIEDTDLERIHYIFSCEEYTEELGAELAGYLKYYFPAEDTVERMLRFTKPELIKPEIIFDLLEYNK